MNTSSVTDFPAISLQEMEGIKLMNRVDTKFLIRADSLPDILERCRENYLVQDMQGVRVARYHTMYYDTPAHDYYLMHLHGKATRQKIRVRTYMDSDNLTFLEIKNKTSKGRTKKKRREVPADCLEHFQDSPSEVMDFFRERSMFPPESLSPSLDIRFDRITLVNRARTERLTIDTGLSFLNPRTDRCSTLSDVVVVELKRDGLTPSAMKDILLDMRVFPAKFSKYCTGVMLTDDSLPRGRFKPRLVKLSKTRNKNTAI